MFISQVFCFHLRTATAAKRSLCKWFCIFSNIVAIIPTRFNAPINVLPQGERKVGIHGLLSSKLCTCRGFVKIIDTGYPRGSDFLDGSQLNPSGLKKFHPVNCLYKKWYSFEKKNASLYFKCIILLDLSSVNSGFQLLTLAQLFLLQQERRKI